MKRVLFLLAGVLYCSLANAQIASWVMQPQYDKIYIATGAPLLISDSLEVSCIWDFNGKRITSTQDVMHHFKEGISVTTQKETENITGFFNNKGEFTPLKNYTLAYNDPFFRDGYLLVKSEDKFIFINKKGEEVNLGDFIKIYPFNNGCASCFTYEQADKLKNPYYTYITTDESPITFIDTNNKPINKIDVEFLSSVNDEGISVAIIKHKVYLFDFKNRKLEPVFANKAETNLKRQVIVDGENNEYLVETEDSFVINAKGGKTEVVKFDFDKFLRPVKIHYTDRIKEFKTNVEKSVEYTSSFSSLKSDDKFGLNYKETPILPAQFDEVGLCLNELAAVRIGKKWGMLTYNPDVKYRFIMHNGKDIAFRHKDVATTIKLELPVDVSADKCRFDIDKKHGCTIDKISLETKNTENGNYVQYECNLVIPDSLPDVITEIQYPVQITYDGVKHPEVPIKAKAWHYKYINVDLDETETTLEQGNVSFTINIAVDKQLGENDYPFEVEIKTDSLQTELVKISEIRYKCKLFSLAEGINNVNINILEDGCPPSVFPFEITYTKPVEKTRTQPEVKEDVKIEKKIKPKAKPKEPEPEKQPLISTESFE